jgi:hypothetical protein
MKGVIAIVIKRFVNRPMDVSKTKKETVKQLIDIIPPIRNIQAGCLMATLKETSFSKTKQTPYLNLRIKEIN